MEHPAAIPTLEDILLSRDARNISRLRPYLPKDFVHRAARCILDHPGTAFLVTGFFILHAGATETDGPPGAAALGRALRTLGYPVAYVTDRLSRTAVAALADGDPVIEFPMADAAASARYAAELLETHRPSLLIAIERPGLFCDGAYRNALGVDVSNFHAKTDALFHGHPASIGIGDGGNEIGMGKIRALLEERGERMDETLCATGTTSLIIASCSNWGAYGLTAALSRMTGRDLLPGVEEARERMRRIVAAGAVDSASATRKAWVDGQPPEEEARCLEDLRAFVRRGSPELRTRPRDAVAASPARPRQSRL